MWNCCLIYNSCLIHHGYNSCKYFSQEHPYSVILVSMMLGTHCSLVPLDGLTVIDIHVAYRSCVPTFKDLPTAVEPTFNKICPGLALPVYTYKDFPTVYTRSMICLYLLYLSLFVPTVKETGLRFVPSQGSSVYWIVHLDKGDSYLSIVYT